MVVWHIVGDSHIDAFRHAAAHGKILAPCRFTQVKGATAVGLRNPNSKTDAMAQFRAGLLPKPDDAIPVFQLGEVDCGFVIWYRARKYGEAIERQVQQSIAAYFDFVDALVAGGYPHVVVTGAVVPTIRDGLDWGEVANARREVTATLFERTALTLSYNDRLRQGATARGLSYIDISSDVIDPATGVVSDVYRNPDPSDHHLDPDKAGSLWAEKLNILSGCLGESGRVVA